MSRSFLSISMVIFLFPDPQKTDSRYQDGELTPEIQFYEFKLKDVLTWIIEKVESLRFQDT